MKRRAIRLKLEKLETAFIVSFWNVILERLNKENIKKQNSTVDLQTVTELYKFLYEFVRNELENFKYFEEMAMEVSVIKEYENETSKRKRKRKIFADKTPEEEIEIIASEHFKVQTYIVIIDRLSTELEKRQVAYLSFLNNF